MQKDQEQRARFRKQLQQQSKNDQKMLDGFLLLHSCKVKLPHEAVHSKLQGMNITQVRDDDLGYFKNLLSIDLADNQVQLDWLANLQNIQEVDLQYNNLERISVEPQTFQHLKYLHLSYNRIDPRSLLNLAHLS